MALKVSFETLGCRYNRFETAEMACDLENAGFVAAGPEETPDVIVINTCSVTSKSEAKCRAAIRQAHAQNPKAAVVVAGCYSQMNPEAIASEEGVALVLGNVEKFDLAMALRDLKNGEGERIRVGTKEAPTTLAVRPVKKLEGRTNAYVKIQSGCGEVCAFCIVKVARGKSISARPEEIVAQVRAMAESGVCEAVFTGINVGEYDGGIGFAGLLEKTLEETDMRRIRISSINPQHVTDELIELMATSPRICRHLHIPLQSGSDGVLKRMRRPYTAAQYEALLNKLAERIPGIGIGADVMVGFPGETEEEFNETYSLIERSPIMMLHVFAYSPRKGTEAFDMPGRLEKSVLKQRSAALKALSGEKRLAAGKAMIGERLEVLVENTRGAGGRLKGFSGNYFPVTFNGPDSLMNTIAEVKIIKAIATGLEGEL